MPKALQQATQARHTTVHPVNEGREPTTPPVVRPAGARAVLVNERRTAWDVPAERVSKANEGVETDPVWDHANFTRWTPDLVHHRFLAMADILGRLPPSVRRDYVSMLGDEALSEMAGPMKSRPTPAEISLMDWTLNRICERPGTQRVIIMGMSFGLGVRTIAGVLSRMGSGFLTLNKNAVGRVYLAERRVLAGEWQAGERSVVLHGKTMVFPIGEPACRLDAVTVARYRAVETPK